MVVVTTNWKLDYMEMENKIKSLIKKLRKFGYHIRPKKWGYVDPVCGMPATDEITLTYGDKTYAFCSDYCRQRFKKDPTTYISK